MLVRLVSNDMTMIPVGRLHAHASDGVIIMISCISIPYPISSFILQTFRRGGGGTAKIKFPKMISCMTDCRRWLLIYVRKLDERLHQADLNFYCFFSFFNIFSFFFSFFFSACSMLFVIFSIPYLFFIFSPDSQFSGFTSS